MIYTVTFNPSLDYIADVPDFRLGHTNRTASERLVTGGKGINVSIVLRNLGWESTALGFIAGFTGDELSRQLEALDIQNGFIRVPNGLTRINLKLKSIDGTEINGRGPDIGPEQLQALMTQLNRLTRDDVLFLSGSIPPSMPDDSYQRIMELLAGRDVRIVVDATGELLTKSLPYRPFLVKPNNHELGALFGVTLSTREEVLPYGRRLQEQGAQNVLISMACEGAVLIAADGSVREAPAPKGTLINAVGAGDSMVAGFMAGFMERQDYAHAFRMGLAAGSACAFSENLATRPEIESVYRQISDDAGEK